MLEQTASRRAAALHPHAYHLLAPLACTPEGGTTCAQNGYAVPLRGTGGKLWVRMGALSGRARR